MDKRILIVAIVVAAIAISTLLQLFIRNRDVSPATRKMLWVSFAAGVVALIAVSFVILTR
jgi:hypothetical protein